MTKKNETAKVLPERSESAEYFEGGDEYDDFDDFQLGQQHGGGGGGGGSRAAKAEKKKTGGLGPFILPNTPDYERPNITSIREVNPEIRKCPRRSDQALEVMCGKRKTHVRQGFLE
eukprot:CAMPEP_0116839692 /NCGR_PEP_ID=MMETSP0418-20121206/9909_1 /TAXON_ID=1158023 /ORGANISM="Astrosyne radiata, Strain 13vi08-1A" /LENGTH=115 /DNA_ID=CAMNT_0004469833 /DNA_START=162 /DNA_END=510 /DNA_ORIENTATION=+